MSDDLAVPEGTPAPDFRKEQCPHCGEPIWQSRLDEHVTTAHADIPPCTATINSPYDGLLHCVFRAGHAEGHGEYGAWHASTADRPIGRHIWNDSASGATPHQAGPEPADATVCTPIPAATLTQMSEVPPELLTEQQRTRADSFEARAALREALDALIHSGGVPPTEPDVDRWRTTLDEPEGRNPVDQQERAAPVDWQAIANGRERELKQVGEARRRAETDLAWQQSVNSDLRVENQARGEKLARVRELRDTWLRMTLEPGQVRRLLDGITHALDGPKETDATQPAPGFVPAAVPKHIPRTGDPAHTLVVEPYRNDRNQDRWVFRCWGTDGGCDGWLGLGHHSEQSAQRERDRHIAEHHPEEQRASALTATEATETARPWGDLRSTGLLWLINRVAFHPRGAALTIHYDAYIASGWSLARTPGGEPWQFDDATDVSGHTRAEATLAAALNPSTEPTMPDPTPTCTATIDGPHTGRDVPVPCALDAHGEEQQHESAPHGPSKTRLHWTDHHAGATPHAGETTP